MIQSTASDAVALCLMAARQKVLSDFQASLIPDKLLVYASDQTHSSIKKGCRVVGFNDSQLRIIPTDSNGSMLTDLFEKQLQEDIANGYIPCCCIATIGTTNTTSIDNLPKIGEICNKKYGNFDIWMHVDGAFMVNACLCPEYRGVLNGCEFANSLNWNPHKWMLTNFDCSVLYVKDRNLLIRALEVNPEYLKNKPTESGLVTDYRNWQVPLGRRMRSLKLWMVIRCYGLSGIRQYLRHHIALAKYFEEELLKDGRFEIVFKRLVSLVCFRVKGMSKEFNKKLLDQLNTSGEIMLTGSEIKGIYFLRMAIGGTWTNQKHIDKALSLIKRALEKLS